jgi:uncharacterized protein
MRLPRPLDLVEIRILGCLLEKEQVTPEYYPLTLNALVAACNQRSNRDPVMDLAEGDVRAALDRLHADVLVWPVLAGRAERWRHALDRWELDSATRSVVTLLLLRGPQTPGELRARAERMHAFASTAEVEAALASLAAPPEPLAVELPRRPGQKEQRWTHLAAGDLPEELLAPGPVVLTAPTGGLAARLDALEAKVESLAAEVAKLSDALGS